MSVKKSATVYDVSEEKAHAVSKTGRKSDQVIVTCMVNKQHQVTFEIDAGVA